MLLTDCDNQQKVTFYFRDIQEAALEMLQDPKAKDHIDFHPKPLFNERSGKRIFGPFSSGLWWQIVQVTHGGKSTLACLIFYSDATRFYKSIGAHPIFSILLPIML